MSFDRKLCFWKGYSLMSETLHYYLKRNENAHVYSQGKRKNTVLQYYVFIYQSLNNNCVVLSPTSQTNTITSNFNMYQDYLETRWGD